MCMDIAIEIRIKSWVGMHLRDKSKMGNYGRRRDRMTGPHDISSLDHAS